MKLALTIVVDGAVEALDAQLAFHLAAGADVVVASRDGASGAATEILESFARGGRVRLVDRGGHTELARLAIEEHEAEWVIPAAADEFWWPRGESLADVLAVIPPRYRVVQGLVRSFAGGKGDGFFGEERTVRSSLLGPDGADGRPPGEMLLPVYRAEPAIVVDPDDWTLGGRRVPLRAWYPIEVLRFPADAAAPDPSRLDALLEEGALARDTRLRDALRSLRDPAGAFAHPAEGSSGLSLSVPSVVDDASYAVECAAVGEVDLVRLDREIRELELRIAGLEARLGPRVRQALRRLARRPR